MSCTTNLSDFGYRELNILASLINAWVQYGLPNDFYNDGVYPMINQNSGNVFLTNSDYQVAMLNGGKLESFYYSPYSGHEGFFEDLLELYPDMNHEDKEWFEDLTKQLNREDELPKDEEEE